MICNARLNLLILHPFPTPSQLPRQTQEPSGLSVPRCQGIKISICGRSRGGGGGECASREGKREEECRPHTSNALDGSAAGRGLQNVLLGVSHPGRQAGRQEPPSLFTNLYLLALDVHLSAGKQNMSSWVPTSLTHTHRHTQAFIRRRKRPADKVSKVN